jgi:hypothetical protein
MSVYEQAYGFTRLRLLVEVVELTLGGAFVLLLVAGIRMTGSWLPRACVGLLSVAVLGIAALNPDSYVAAHNVTRYEQTGQVDVAYLAGLSADAVPALLSLPAALRSCDLVSLAPALSESSATWYDVNLARSDARQLLRKTPVAACPGSALGG